MFQYHYYRSGKFASIFAGAFAIACAPLPKEEIGAPPVTAEADAERGGPETRGGAGAELDGIPHGPDLPARFRNPAGLGFSSQCGSDIDYADVERYPEEFLNPYFKEKFYQTDQQAGAMVKTPNPFDENFVNLHRPTTVLIRWADAQTVRNELRRRWGAGASINPNSAVSSTAEERHFCTGTLIDGNRILTAGHCVENKYRPYRRLQDGNIEYLEPANVARLLEIVFDYRIDNLTGAAIFGESHAVTALIDYKNDWVVDQFGNELAPILDYALLQVCDAPIDVSRQGAACLARGVSAPDDAQIVRRISGSGRRIAVVAATGAVAKNKVALIQHPGGLPKKVDVGSVSAVESDIARYKNIDTTFGSSGSGVLSEGGEIVAVHVAGGCAKNENSPSNIGNGAVNINAIREASPNL